MEVVTDNPIPVLPLVRQEASRDVYELSEDTVLVVYMDRFDAYGSVLREPIPYKGVMQNQISNFWMSKFAHFVKNYRLTGKLDAFPLLRDYASVLKGRSVVAKKSSRCRFSSRSSAA